MAGVSPNTTFMPGAALAGAQAQGADSRHSLRRPQMAAMINN
ncbi:MAG: hypothetical protein ABJU19_11120 [Roseobacter sp.]